MIAAEWGKKLAALHSFLITNSLKERRLVIQLNF